MNLSESIKTLSGVGPKRATALGEMGIKTVSDLLHHYPRSHVFARYSTIPDFREGDKVVFQATVMKVTRIKHFFIVKLMDGEYETTCMFFNVPSIRAMLRVNGSYWFWGKAIIPPYRGGFQLTNPQFSQREPTGIFDSGAPVYPATKAVPSDMIAKLIKQVLNACSQVDLKQVDVAPTDFMHPVNAIRAIHFPEDKQQLQRARKTLKYIEIRDVLQRMDSQKQQAKLSKVFCAVGRDRGGNFYSDKAYQPFDIEFTGDQVRATLDIEAGLDSHLRMNRLLQGDVGCGKTAVAQWASLYVANCGMQTVVMCPTLALARQHYESWSRLFMGTEFCVGLLTSENSEYCCGCGVIIATTSALSDKVEFDKLGLLIVDEEHKFGKDQKDKLYHKYGTNRLLMTATPIPAALTATLFADLDVTTIREMPAGRGKRTTRVLLPGDHGSVPLSGQIYEVFSRIEGPGGIEEAVHVPFNGEFRAVCHGNRKPAHNAAAIGAFHRGEVKRMYCTSMLEVGIDNPNANTIIVHDANMFGLSQLHQMRGRVGRGTDDSYCYLLLDTADEVAHDRVRFLETCDDGFEVAEKDLELRGPGELAGNRQTGLAEFKLTDLVSDYGLIKRVRKDLRLC
ncbi:hypothetical protein LCGC14_1296360 [marine sediment metagenome]|uniref:Probable DNA 3'-5' helicase RecG n=1 Tax=marine sediment metagenome TaxID=412755 RepID=A0A0F9LBI0_9ZZZZ